MKNSPLLKKHSNNELGYELFLIFLWCRSLLVGYARALWTMLPEVWGLADLMVDIMFYGLLFFALTTFWRRMWVRDILFFAFALLIYVAYYWICPLNQRYYTMYSDIFAEKALPMFLVGSSILPKKSQRLYRWMYWASIVTVIAFSAYKLVIHPLSSGTQSDGDMWAAYFFLPHLCVVSGYAMKKPNPLNIAISVLGIFVLVSLGTRGTVVCYLAFVILFLFFFQKTKHPIIIITLFVAMVVVLLFGGLLEWLYKFAEEFNLSLRVLDKLQSGNFGQSQGRVAIAERLLEHIVLYPLTGLGIYSDRRVAGGHYAHNILLELLINFGVILGTLLFVLIVALIVKATFCVRRYENNDGTSIVLLAYICAGFLKLFLSGSYLNEDTFFFLLGFCFAILREEKLEKRRSPGIREPEGG